MAEEELKNCPFCGGKAEIKSYIQKCAPFVVGCLEPLCRGNIFDCPPSVVKYIAVEKWNRRAEK